MMKMMMFFIVMALFAFTHMPGNANAATSAGEPMDKAQDAGQWSGKDVKNQAGESQTPERWVANRTVTPGGVVIGETHGPNEYWDWANRGVYKGPDSDTGHRHILNWP